MKEIYRKWGILITRKDGTQCFSTSTFFDRKEATQHRQELRQHISSDTKVVRVRVTTESIDL